MFYNANISLFLLLLTALPAAAQVYKHVDEHGRVTYSNQPPASGASAAQVQIQQLSPEQKAAAQAEREKFLEQQRAKKEQEKQAATAQKAECDKMLSLRTQLRLPGPFSMPMEDGKVLVVSGRQKTELLWSTQASIREKCPNAP